MAVVDTAAVVLHVLFAGLWAGSVALYAWRVHPALAAGAVEEGAARRLMSGLQWLTRASAVVLLASGGYLAGEHFSGASLTGTTGGQLVLAMIGLWLVLTGLVEVLGRRVAGATDVAAAAGDTTTLARLAGAVAVALLLVGGLVAA